MSDRKKEYDRKRAKKKYQEYKAERSEVLELLGGCCALCSRETNLQLHHNYYDEKSDYPRTGNGWSRIRRVREAQIDPEKFTVLCGGCHKHLHWAEEHIEKLIPLLSLHSPPEGL